MKKLVLLLSVLLWGTSCQHEVLKKDFTTPVNKEKTISKIKFIKANPTEIIIRSANLSKEDYILFTMDDGIVMQIKDNNKDHFLNIMTENSQALQSFFSVAPVKFEYHLHYIKFNNGNGRSLVLVVNNKFGREWKKNNPYEKFQWINGLAFWKNRIATKIDKHTLSEIKTIKEFFSYAEKLPSPGKSCSKCTAGGEGATSCSVGDRFSDCSVSCGDGYYACCNGDSNTCYCCPN